MEHAAYPARVRRRVEGGGAVRRILTAFLLLPLIAFSQASDWYMDFDEDFAAASSKKAEPVTLTFEYVSTYPATIKIGAGSYGQPADPSKALVDAGDGVFVPWTSKTITIKGKRIRFRGDWRNSSGNFRDLFSGTFGGGHNVTMSGGFDFEGAPAANMFRGTFYGCSNLTGSIPSGLFGNIFGAPAAQMFYATFFNCSNLTGSIPAGLFGNISGAPAAEIFLYTFYGCSKLTGSIPSGLFGNISGTPAADMFRSTFYNCSNLTGSIPSGLFGNISGAPAVNMFYATFFNCSNLTGSIPVGLFGDISGAPASSMFHNTFYNCSNLTGSIPVGLFGDISGEPAAEMFRQTFTRCSKLTGESALMPDGVTHLYEQFSTASGTQCDNCFYGATGLNDYATMPAAWK
jgi:hypothetical protein